MRAVTDSLRTRVLAPTTRSVKTETARRVFVYAHQRLGSYLTQRLVIRSSSAESELGRSGEEPSALRGDFWSIVARKQLFRSHEYSKTQFDELLVFVESSQCRTDIAADLV